MSIVPPLSSRVLLTERTQEILEYLKFLRIVLSTNASLHIPSNEKKIPISKELTHTLKANGYLLLYNVVEATMTQAIADIHNAIEARINESDSILVLDDMNPSLYAHILRRFKVGKEQIDNSVTPLSGRLIVKYWLRDHAKLVSANQNPLFSGNIDGRKIFEVAQKYGYASFGEEGRLTDNSLLTAKTNRNKLAHGEISFMDCGKSISAPDLIKDAIGVIRCLRHNLFAIETFIDQAGYKFNSNPPSPQLQADGQLLQPA